MTWKKYDERAAPSWNLVVLWLCLLIVGKKKTVTKKMTACDRQCIVVCDSVPQRRTVLTVCGRVWHWLSVCDTCLTLCAVAYLGIWKPRGRGTFLGAPAFWNLTRDNGVIFKVKQISDTHFGTSLNLGPGGNFLIWTPPLTHTSYATEFVIVCDSIDSVTVDWPS